MQLEIEHNRNNYFCILVYACYHDSIPAQINVRDKKGKQMSGEQFLYISNDYINF